MVNNFKVSFSQSRRKSCKSKSRHFPDKMRETERSGSSTLLAKEAPEYLREISINTGYRQKLSYRACVFRLVIMRSLIMLSSIRVNVTKFLRTIIKVLRIQMRGMLVGFIYLTFSGSPCHRKR